MNAQVVLLQVVYRGNRINKSSREGLTGLARNPYMAFESETSRGAG